MEIFQLLNKMSTVLCQVCLFSSLKIVMSITKNPIYNNIGFFVFIIIKPQITSAYLTCFRIKVIILFIFIILLVIALLVIVAPDIASISKSLVKFLN